MEMNTRFNYYDILELSPQCNQHEVTDAYQKAKATYSSNNPALYTIFTDNEAREYLSLVEEAYSVLGNRALRSLYDEKMATNTKENTQVTYETLVEQSRIAKNLMIVKAPRFKLSHPTDDQFEQVIATQKNWDGDFIRKVREYKQVPIETMSEVTKITAYYINALENMEIKNLPAVVFVRGYVIQICRVLQLDEKIVADSYMKNFREKLGAS